MDLRPDLHEHHIPTPITLPLPYDGGNGRCSVGSGGSGGGDGRFGVGSGGSGGGDGRCGVGSGGSDGGDQNKSQSLIIKNPE